MFVEEWAQFMLHPDLSSQREDLQIPFATGAGLKSTTTPCLSTAIVMAPALRRCGLESKTAYCMSELLILVQSLGLALRC